MTQVFHHSAHVREFHESTISTDFEITNKFYQVGKFTNTKSANNKDLPYMHLYICSAIRFPNKDFGFLLSVSKGHRLKIKPSLQELTDKMGGHKLPSGMISQKAL